jgi:hypothetical protein
MEPSRRRPLLPKRAASRARNNPSIRLPASRNPHNSALTVPRSTLCNTSTIASGSPPTDRGRKLSTAHVKRSSLELIRKTRTKKGLGGNFNARFVRPQEPMSSSRSAQNEHEGKGSGMEIDVLNCVEVPESGTGGNRNEDDGSFVEDALPDEVGEMRIPSTQITNEERTDSGIDGDLDLITLSPLHEDRQAQRSTFCGASSRIRTVFNGSSTTGSSSSREQEEQLPKEIENNSELDEQSHEENVIGHDAESGDAEGQLQAIDRTVNAIRGSTIYIYI